MVKDLVKLRHILPAKNLSLILMILLFLFSSLLEVFGIGVVGPFIALASNTKIIYETPYLERIFNLVGVFDEKQFVVFVGCVVILFFCIKTFVAWTTQVIIVAFSDKQQKLIVARMTEEYLSAPYIYHTRKSTSSIVDAIIEVANTFTGMILLPLLTATSNIFVASFLFILLYKTSSLTVIVFIIALLPVILLMNKFRAKVPAWGKAVRRSKEEIIRIINHAFGGIKETKIIGCESYFNDKVLERAENLEKAHVNFASFQMIPRYLMEIVAVLGVVATVNVSILSGSNTDDLTSTLGVFALASIRLIPSISNTFSGVNKLRNSSYTINQLYLDSTELQKFSQQEAQSILQLDGSQRKPRLSSDLKSHPVENGHSDSLPANGEIILDQVSYTYAGALEYAVKDISLKIKKGESIAFIGKSGSGKTTLVDIILGLLSPQLGDISFGGDSIYQDVSSWQKRIGYIPQSIFLMDDTIENNIAFGVPKELIDRAKLYQAISAAHLDEVVENLPDGVNTNVGERGVLLSGGQRQRIGIARSLYHDSEILVLDEATAALDTETEKLVTESIKSLSGKKTIITIAHRLSTIEHCDCVYLLNHGEIVKSGKYEEVVHADANS
ncbi:MAG: ABC transporter ATP-binding protein [Cyanobacteria bacterium J06650_10]